MESVGGGAGACAESLRACCTSLGTSRPAARIASSRRSLSSSVCCSDWLLSTNRFFQYDTIDCLSSAPHNSHMSVHWYIHDTSPYLEDF